MKIHRTTVVAAAAVLGMSLAALAADAPKPASPARNPPAAKTAPPAGAAPAAGAMQMPGKLADFFIFWPKAGHEAEFLAGVKTHLAWRKQAKEGFNWEAFQPILGSDLNRFVFRSGEHQWADFDAENAWTMTSHANEAFDRDVLPHVDHYVHMMAEEDYENSHWVESTDYKYFMVIEHKLTPGGSGAIAAATGKIHKALQAGGWPRSYALSRGIGGTGGLTLVFPYKSYAEMEDPKPGFMEVLAKGMGSAEEAGKVMQQFEEAVVESDTTIYLSRPDLSTPK